MTASQQDASASFQVHPTAVIDEGAAIGGGTRIWHFVHVCSGARIGERCSLGQNVFVGRGVTIGDGVKVQNNVSIYEGVEIEDEVFLGPSAVFTNVVNPRAFIERKSEYRPTRVGRGATVGANATIVCGHDLGAFSFVGAGAVVTRSVPAFGLVVGNPARRVGWMCRCGVRLPEGAEVACSACGRRYSVDGETCAEVAPPAEGSADDAGRVRVSERRRRGARGTGAAVPAKASVLRGEASMRLTEADSVPVSFRASAPDSVIIVSARDFESVPPPGPASSPESAAVLSARDVQSVPPSRGSESPESVVVLSARDVHSAPPSRGSESPESLIVLSARDVYSAPPSILDTPSAREIASVPIPLLEAKVRAKAAADAPIPLVDVKAQNDAILPEIQAAVERVIRSGHFILGDEVSRFESEIAERLGVRFAIGVSSGTDALLAALMALGIGRGDQVVTSPYSFFATAGVIARLGANPVFADIDPDTYNLDPASLKRVLQKRTKAILPVHLFGQACSPEAVRDLAAEKKLPIVEDAAQALGARTPIGPAGGLGQLACFSFFPTKNLGALGDAGLVTTNDPDLAERVRVLRAHGAKPKYHHETIGGNFRLDALQAAVLRAKLPHLDRWTEARRENAALYTSLFREAGLPATELAFPREPAHPESHVWNQYVLRTPRRDALREHLASKGIATEIYYPTPLHLQPCFAKLGYRPGTLPQAERASRETLAIPVFPELGEARARRIAREIVAFLREG